jgi:hypothetical protein
MQLGQQNASLLVEVIYDMIVLDLLYYDIIVKSLLYVLSDSHVNDGTDRYCSVQVRYRFMLVRYRLTSYQY